jgi:hypothetical protein
VLAFFVVVFGFALNQFQMGRMLDRQFVYANIHESFEDKRERVWNRPDKQRILGTIKDIDTQKGIVVFQQTGQTEPLSHMAILTQFSKGLAV